MRKAKAAKLPPAMLARMAAMRARGLNNKQIAQELGLSKSAVDHHITSQPVRELLRMAYEERVDELREIASQTVDAVRNALGATMLVNLGGEAGVREVPDHRSRMLAVRELERIMTMIEPPGSSRDDQAGKYTLAELLIRYRERPPEGPGQT